jgi:energy-coupling factor transporter ATP-binding protein EcfA2
MLRQKGWVGMKLMRAQVTNYRCVEDSEEFSVGDMLCLVGKNEAGKSAVLQAIAGINPHPLTPVAYIKERDYPRRFLTEYDERHPFEQAVVATTWWRPQANSLRLITERIGAQGLKDEPVIVLRRYQATGVEWRIPIDEFKAVEFLLDQERLDGNERRGLKTETSDELRRSLEALEQVTDRQRLLLQRLNAMPEKNVRGLVISILTDHLPRFVFFTHYDRMIGDMRVDDITKSDHGRVHSSRPDSAPRQLEAGEMIFLDFLEFAGASIEEICKSTTYESLNAKCEAASIKITDQLREYWTQNPHLDIDIRVTNAEGGDRSPLNAGTIARARVRNTVRRVSVPFTERSAGFIWFFSFLVKFAQVRKLGGNLVLLLDEPGLTLHGRAQADLLRYFVDRITPHHQLVYSTHSPFMVPTDDLSKSRVVEDDIVPTRPGGPWTTKGTKVKDDVLATDPDTVLPLLGALGYDFAKTQFMGRNTLLVDGPADVLFLHCFSQQLRRRNRTALDQRWTICPAGGLEKIQSFVSFFSGTNLDVAAITGFDVSNSKKLETLRKSQLVKPGRLLIFADALGLPEADVEDIFDPEVYVRIVNQAFQLPVAEKLTVAKLDAAAPGTARLAKRVEAAFKLLPASTFEFDRFATAEWLLRNPEALDGNGPRIESTLENAERVFRAVNYKLLDA